MIYQKQHSIIDYITSLSPALKQLLTPIPSGTILPATFTQTSWKTYTSNTVGVSFAYPPVIKLLSEEPEKHNQSPFYNQPTILEDPGNYLGIFYAFGYEFRITKIITNQTLKTWFSQYERNDKNSMYHFANDSTNEYNTTFDRLPAILSLETPEMVKSTQVPESIYYVKANPNTIYIIEYVIPLPSDKNETSEEKELRGYIPQILGSIKFI